jgi:DNA-directed RNA polymerase specialized sigma54-like protein
VTRRVVGVFFIAFFIGADSDKSTDEEVQGIVARVLSNQDSKKRLSDQVVAELVFKEKANPTTKKLLMMNL